MYLSSAVNHTCVTEEEFQELVESVVAASSLGMNPLADDPGDANIHWSIPNAIFFSCSVITTIGEPFLSSTRLDRHMAYNNFWAAVSPPPSVSHFYPRQDYRHMAITFQLQCHHRDRWAISILDTWDAIDAWHNNVNITSKLCRRPCRIIITVCGIPNSQCYWWNLLVSVWNQAGPLFTKKTRHTGFGIPIINLRRSDDHLRF